MEVLRAATVEVSEMTGEQFEDSYDTEEHESCHEVTCEREECMEVLRAATVEVAEMTGEQFEDSYDTEEHESCHEVTCEREECMEVLRAANEDMDELAGEIDTNIISSNIQPMEAEPRDELADFQEVELLRAEEIDSGALDGDLLYAEEEARSLSADVVNEIINVVESGAEEEEAYLTY